MYSRPLDFSALAWQFQRKLDLPFFPPISRTSIKKTESQGRYLQPRNVLEGHIQSEPDKECVLPGVCIFIGVLL